jgi:hypothetical protein
VTATKHATQGASIARDLARVAERLVERFDARGALAATMRELALATSDPSATFAMKARLIARAAGECRALARAEAAMVTRGASR